MDACGGKKLNRPKIRETILRLLIKQKRIKILHMATIILYISNGRLPKKSDKSYFDLYAYHTTDKYELLGFERITVTTSIVEMEAVYRFKKK